MKTLLIGLFILLGHTQAFSSECSEDDLYKAIRVHETETSPYSDGQYEYTIQELSLSQEENGSKIYNAVINYENSEGGYRLIEITSQYKDGSCQSQLNVTDES